MIEVVLKEDGKIFKSKIYDVIANHINSILFRKRGAIIRDIRMLMAKWILSQPEMKSLQSDTGIGSLSAQLGLDFGTGPEAVDAIVRAMVDSISIDVSKINKKTLKGGINVKFMPATFADLLALPEGKVITDKGQELHWLKWLLMDGFKVIVVGYKFNFRSGGRSGGGFMTEGGVWRVPPEFAGTKENNFITRALTGRKNEEEISRVFQRHVR